MTKLFRQSILLIGALVVAGCSTAAAEAADTTTSTSPQPETITVTAIDYAFVGLPATIDAGTTLVLDNQSEIEVHELVAIRLPDDEARPVSELVQLPPDEMAAFFPLVETVLIAPPTEQGFPVEGTGTLTEPGRYAILCVIPTGADPAEYLAAAAEAEGGPPEVAGGPPHIMNGMYAELTVEG